MSEYQIYHNPRCSKSRETLELLTSHGIEPKIIEYLKTPPSETEILELLEKLESSPASLVRVKEDLFKDNAFKIETNEEIARLIAKHPQLMERPLVVKGHRAVLGRPPLQVETLF
ncbi:MAG: arsenate reductase (glutaredoxin) [Bdellovibrionaceae bacterium]|nr:arsenate reductase (glutaredoxin) [Pseudobdellovibrionaceae bacterium]|tara:strand:+ start:71428 stop:71772 length:345 start_codon:yes stop_codon:yes gene_type:complete